MKRVVIVRPEQAALLRELELGIDVAVEKFNLAANAILAGTGYGRIVGIQDHAVVIEGDHASAA